ncbi:MAG TPA: Ger(x)C family spore germination protein [Lentibacillus sp.]|uniref:Ger(x)C family spore germination protein n=1 Tax=Lentibacillus sp. TaxID=1925746 RepID=UPI002B4B027C|nr:Ger(x)C family spore germination protein [Lentibacillus sp.]HLR61386.1 Ger(x)C family spore germination protein [Lentibacillus sp.]
MITKRLGQAVLLLSCLLLTTGCWDQRLFKDAQLIFSTGADLTESGKINTTVSIPYVQKSEQGVGEESVQIVSARADTPREARMKIDEKMPRRLDASKMKVIVLGKEVAEQKIYPVLDVFYRNPNSNMSAKVAVAEDSAEDVISMKGTEQQKISEYLSRLLEGAETSSIIPQQDVQLVTSIMFDPGQDFMLPLLSSVEGGSIKNIKGLAIFNGQTYTGEILTPEEGVLFQLLDNNKGRRARLTKKISKDRNPKILNYITIDVNNVDSRIDIVIDKDRNITVNLNTDLTVKAIEYPKDQLNTEKEINKLNKELSQNLTKEAEEIIQKLQDVNSDPLGIGKRMIAFHHDTWESLDWKEAYPDITFNTEVNVEIVQRGIIH